MTSPDAEIGPPSPRWTHVALPVAEVERSLAWYAEFTPLVPVALFEDGTGRTAWLSNEGQFTDPFVLVLVTFHSDRGTRHPLLAPFAHIGIEMPHRHQVDDIAARARRVGCLRMEPADIPYPVGYVCMITDPDGNTLEFSHGQQVYSQIRHNEARATKQRWDYPAPSPASIEAN
ncbi:VOC family protein [Streptomyces collinus]|uniref:VOC family protein n=1 Tax=Streptomyces collinus TaxID=42684 RepID=UPI00368286AD